MKRVLALAVLGLVAGGCSSDGPRNSPPANSDARRAELHRSIVENTPFKKVSAECVLHGVDRQRRHHGRCIIVRSNW